MACARARASSPSRARTEACSTRTRSWRLIGSSRRTTRSCSTEHRRVGPRSLARGGRTNTPTDRGRRAAAGMWDARRGALLVEAVERRAVARLPSLAHPRGAEVPVGADLAADGAQVVPQVDERGAPPEPVAV